MLKGPRVRYTYSIFLHPGTRRIGLSSAVSLPYLTLPYRRISISSVAPRVAAIVVPPRLLRPSVASLERARRMAVAVVRIARLAGHLDAKRHPLLHASSLCGRERRDGRQAASDRLFDRRPPSGCGDGRVLGVLVLLVPLVSRCQLNLKVGPVHRLSTRVCWRRGGRRRWAVRRRAARSVCRLLACCVLLR